MKQIEVFVRHCPGAYSKAKNRPSYFSFEKCWYNLKSTLDCRICNVTHLIDGDINSCFLKEEKDFRVIPNPLGGCESKSFLGLLQTVKEQNFSDDVVVYALEEDYLHRPNWCQILLEGIALY
jgi:hypothetical protein